jgi:hypothetical protein
MAKLKKYPKKPKANASVDTLKRYLDKCKEVDKANAPIKKATKEKEALKKKIANLKR